LELHAAIAGVLICLLETAYPVSYLESPDTGVLLNLRLRNARDDRPYDGNVSVRTYHDRLNVAAFGPEFFPHEHEGTLGLLDLPDYFGASDATIFSKRGLRATDPSRDEKQLTITSVARIRAAMANCSSARSFSPVHA